MYLDRLQSSVTIQLCTTLCSQPSTPGHVHPAFNPTPLLPAQKKNPPPHPILVFPLMEFPDFNLNFTKRRNKTADAAANRGPKTGSTYFSF